MSDEEECFHFFRPRDRYSFDSSSDSSTEVVGLPNSVCPEPITSLVYIDDYNNVKNVRVKDAQSHMTVNRRELKVLAAKSELQFNSVRRLADGRYKNEG